MEEFVHYFFFLRSLSNIVHQIAEFFGIKDPNSKLPGFRFSITVENLANAKGAREPLILPASSTGGSMHGRLRQHEVVPSATISGGGAGG